MNPIRDAAIIDGSGVQEKGFPPLAREPARLPAPLGLEALDTLPLILHLLAPIASSSYINNNKPLESNYRY